MTTTCGAMKSHVQPLPTRAPCQEASVRRHAELYVTEWLEVRRLAEAWRINQPFDVAIRGLDTIDDNATPLLVGGAFDRGKQVPIASPTSVRQLPEWRTVESRIAAWQ